jgi:dTDP-4-amino-4,6-dideoxygalactose transaminase
MIPFLDLPAMHNEIRAELEEAWRATAASGQFIGGPVVNRFEEEWAEYCQTKHCVGLKSGTVALQLVLSALGIGTGDDVLVPTNTFIATAAAVVAAGARPVFVDVDPATLSVTAEGIRGAITASTAAVIVVHLFGQPANMDAINKVAAEVGIAVIEDAAQAHGATWNGRKAGSLSAAGCFSFYPGKNLGAFGDAGAVVTNDGALADKIRALSNHGRRQHDPYCHDMIGGNHRIDALQAAILSVKLTRLEAWNAGRRHAALRYAAALSDLPVELQAADPAALSSHHLMVIQVDRRDSLRRALNAERIGSGVHYPIPCHRQEPFISDDVADFPVAERAAGRMLSLPMFPHLSDAQVERVVDVIQRALEVDMRRSRQMVE